MGSTWNSVTMPPMNIINDIGYNGSRWVAVGSDITSNTTISILYSDDDGLTWTAATSNPFSGTPFTDNSQGKRVKWNGSYWVACGSNNDGSVTIAYSYNGDTWYPAVTNPLKICYDIAWNGSLWVAVGTDNPFSQTVQVVTSTNGIIWTAATGTPVPYGTGTADYPTTVLWNGNIWVMGGRSATAKSLFYSYDGQTWVQISGTDPFNAAFGCMRIKWNGLYFLASGYTGLSTSSIAISYDGKTWSLLGSPPFSGNGLVSDLTWNGTKWIACQLIATIYGRFSESTDGINWTTISVPSILTTIQSIGNSTPFWKTTPSTSEIATRRFLSSIYFTSGNLI